MIANYHEYYYLIFNDQSKIVVVIVISIPTNGITIVLLYIRTLYQIIKIYNL